ncbi:unnamed protein product [Scytosiphon promiscuus]
MHRCEWPPQQKHRRRNARVFDTSRTSKPRYFDTCRSILRKQYSEYFTFAACPQMQIQAEKQGKCGLLLCRERESEKLSTCGSRGGRVRDRQAERQTALHTISEFQMKKYGSHRGHAPAIRAEKYL